MDKKEEIPRRENLFRNRSRISKAVKTIELIECAATKAITENTRINQKYRFVLILIRTSVIKINRKNKLPKRVPVTTYCIIVMGTAEINKA
jgi:hypothetical protein